MIYYVEKKFVTKILHEVPKVELHFHLEGAIPLEAMWKLVQKYDEGKNVGSIDELQKRFEYTDFLHFLQTWSWKNQFIKEYEDFTYIAKAVAEDIKSQNIVYVEAFYSPIDFSERHNLEIQEITHAIRKGLNSVSGVKVNLITDLVRNFGEEKAFQTLEKIKEQKSDGVIGIGIGGSEQEYPPELFTRVYEKARSYDLRTTAHAGEAVGSNSIWSALKSLKVERIGHGTTAIQDQNLVKYLREKQIPLEMCPGSNVKTSTIPHLKNHPIKEFYEKGLLVSVNTDDPKMFHTQMISEYISLMETFDFSLTQIFDLIRNGVKSLWCDNTEKEKLYAKIDMHEQKFN